MVYTEEEIENIRLSCLIASQALGVASRIIKVGITSQEIDQEVESFIVGKGAVPAFKGYRNFPASICASINEEVVHGIPNKRLLKEGDIISVDVGVLLNGFYGDTAYTFPVGEVNTSLTRLMQVTKDSLDLAISSAVVGKRIGAIGHAVQTLAESHGYGIVRELSGHGVGRHLHEDPHVPNFGKETDGELIEEGMVFAIEPMINSGTAKVRLTGDGWTIRTQDRKASAHFEHTVAIIDGKAERLTNFEFIESVK